MLGRDDETSSPLIDGLRRKERGKTRNQRIPTRTCEEDQQQSCVCPRRVPAHVGKVQILRDQKTVTRLSGLPYLIVGASGEAFLPHRIDVVSQLLESRYQALGQILIQLDVQRLMGASANGMSS